MELIFNSLIIHLVVFFFGILFSFMIFSMIFFPLYLRLKGYEKKPIKAYIESDLEYAQRIQKKGG